MPSVTGRDLRLLRIEPANQLFNGLINAVGIKMIKAFAPKSAIDTVKPETLVNHK